MKAVETAIQFTASALNPVTHEIMEEVIKREFPKTAKHISGIKIGTGNGQFTRDPYQIIEVTIDHKAFGKVRPLHGANQVAFNMLYGLNDKGIDVSPEATIIQRQGPFYRREDITVNFSIDRKQNLFTVHDDLQEYHFPISIDEPLKNPITTHSFTPK